MYFAAKLRLPVQAGGLCRKSSIKFIQPYVSALTFLRLPAPLRHSQRGQARFQPP